MSRFLSSHLRCTFALFGLVSGLNIAGAETLFTNGTVITETVNGTALSVIVAPNATFGFSADSGNMNRIADDFSIATGVAVIDYVDVYSYQGGANSFTFTSANLQIFHGDSPDDAYVTYKLSNLPVTDQGFVAYRVPSTNLSITNRPIYRVRIEFPFGLVLPRGRYWLSYSLSGSLANGPFAPSAMNSDRSPTVGSMLHDALGAGFGPATIAGPNVQATLPMEGYGDQCGENLEGVSTFNVARDSWSVAQITDAATNPPTVNNTFNAVYNANGHPGGCIQSTNTSNADSYWQASTLFLGDKSSVYGGLFRCAISHDGPGGTEDSAKDVIMVGGGNTLSHTWARPTSVWRTFEVPIEEGYWFLSSGARASETQIRNTIANLTALYVRAEHSSTTTLARLDNPMFVTGLKPVNLISNSSFESPPTASFNDFGPGSVIGSGWEVAQATTTVTLQDNLFVPGGISFYDTPAGAQFLLIGTDTTAARVRQKVNLQGNRPYALTWLQANYATPFGAGSVKVSVRDSADATVVVNPFTLDTLELDFFSRRYTTFMVPSTGLYSVNFESTVNKPALIDDVRLHRIGQVNGKIELQGLIPDEQDRNVIMTVDAGNGDVQDYLVKLGFNGEFQFYTDRCNTIVLYCKGSKWLRKSFGKVPVGFQSQYVTATLLNGDCNNDNVISTDDYLILNDAFDLSLGDAGFDPRADLNGDDYVGTDDYILLSDNFDREGDAL